MATYRITEVEIDGVPVAVGDHVLFAFLTHDPTNWIGVEGIVGAIVDGPEPSVLLHADAMYEIASMASVVVLAEPEHGQGDGDPDEREAIVTEHYRTAWDRVLDGEGTP